MSFLEELINIMNSFELSFKAIGECEDEKSKRMKEGFYLIYSQMENILKKHNVTRIEALDKQFDPSMHESVETHLDPDKPEGLIVEEFQKGYMYKDVVLMPAKVKVIKNI
jgi:molecular chaperone GrpE